MTRTFISCYTRLPRRVPTHSPLLSTSSRSTPRCASTPGPARPSIAISNSLPRTPSRTLHTTPRLLSHPDANPNPNNNNHDSPPKPPPKKPNLIRRVLLPIILPISLALTLLLLDSPTDKSTKPLNQTSFTPFTITARDQVSPTAFILTLAPAATTTDAAAAATREVIDAAWKHGLWSVEVKQPQLQVARDYTPLPPAGEGGQEAGMVRLLIRRMEKGEVSGYLAGLGVGDEVEIRGPRLGFDVKERVGVAPPATNDGEGGGAERNKVVFLAGGTGIAPALQAARALFMKGKEAERVMGMEVVWANRRREDCEQGVMVGMLEEMKRRSGGKFGYVCTVDEEGSFIDAGTITRATGVSTSTGGRSSWWWPFGSVSNSGVAASEHTVVSDACRYHSAKKLVVSDDRDDEDSAGTGKHCRCEDGNGKRVAGGKNLLMVSGPDGFIERFTGAKVWGGGKELQGPVKGVVGELRRQYPSLGDDWLVLKM